MGGRGEELARRLEEVRSRIATACADVGRDPGQVTLVAVTKFFPASDVEELLGLGVTQVAENKDQEAGAKVAELPPSVREALTVHFVGQLQSNKARRVAGYADVVQCVDRAKLIRGLDGGRAAALDAGVATEPLDVLLQVDLGEGGRAGRGGAAPAELPALAEAVADAPHLRLRGVMAVAPLGLDDAGTRAAHERLVALGQQLGRAHPGADVVSAGMSGDLELAIAAGATHLRVGSAILGSRPAAR